MIYKSYNSLSEIITNELDKRQFEFSGDLKTDKGVVALYSGNSILRRSDLVLDVRAIKMMDHWLFKADKRFYANRIHFALSPVQKMQIPFAFNFTNEKKFIDGEHDGQTLYVTVMEEGILKPRKELVIKYFRCRQEPFVTFIMAKNLIYIYDRKGYELFAEGFNKYDIEAFGLSKVEKLTLI